MNCSTLRMHLSSVLIVSILVIAVTGSGCTGSPASPSVPPANASLSSLALTPAELPPGFTQAESREKTLNDVGSLARDLGWDGGYGISYTRPGPDPGNATTILQSIAIYPVQNIPAITTMADSQDRAGFNPTDTSNLTLEDLGANSRGFSISASPVSSVTATVNETSCDIAEIIFSKGRTFEVLRMSGPGTDIAILKSLAETAYAKIP
jgi:hypothetical protein